MNTTIWGQPVRIPLLARAGVGNVNNPTEAAYATLDSGSPAQRVRLSDTLLSDERIADLLGSNDARQRRLAMNALNDRMQLYGDVITRSRTVQLVGNTNFPDLRNAGLPVAVELTDAIRQQVDTRWPVLYNVQDRRSEPWPGYFKIKDLYHAITVRQYQPGERIEFGSIEGTEVILEHFLYGTGLQWNELLMAGLWERQEGVSAMLTRWANFQAQLAYQTICGPGLQVTNYVNDDGLGAPSLQNDIATINQAMLDIRAALFAAAAPRSGQVTEEIIPPGAAYYLLYNDATAGYEDRINSALGVRFQAALEGGIPALREINRPVIPIGSPYVPTGAWYMTISGRKNVFSTFRDLRFYDFTDPRVAGVAEGEVGWGAFRFVRGDVNQCRQVAVA